jgi:cobaltochelatase CobS
MTREELIEVIQKREDFITRFGGRPGKADVLKLAEEQKAKFEADLAAMDAQNAPLPVPPTTLNPDDPMSGVLASLATLMSVGGAGSDSVEIRRMIEDVLQDKKISLSELSKEVIDEIKKNQLVILDLPQYGQQIPISKDQSKIPNIYEYIDDVFAGNNIYLIGDAGSGKTYSAEIVAEILKRDYTMINCSQYTSPTEIIGGQTIEGYKDGKLILAWEKGKILILDEMPKLDPNTAGLLNAALAKSSKTKPDEMAKINSANPDQPPIPRNKDFAVIATGNTYPNTQPSRMYVGNNQQDLSLLDRFSGSVYYVNYDEYIDQKSCRYNFLYEMLVGNYYDYMQKKRNGRALPEPIGLRTVIEATNSKNFSLTSYRTLTSFRVAFEYQLVRAIFNKERPKSEHVDINQGKTVLKAWHSYLVAFESDPTAKATILSTTKFTDSYILMKVNDAINAIVGGGKKEWASALTPMIREDADFAWEQSQSWIASYVTLDK